jgi:hypothetical protein
MAPNPNMPSKPTSSMMSMMPIEPLYLGAMGPNTMQQPLKQSIASTRFPSVSIPSEEQILSSKITKRAYTLDENLKELEHLEALDTVFYPQPNNENQSFNKNEQEDDQSNPGAGFVLDDL